MAFCNHRIHIFVVYVDKFSLQSENNPALSQILKLKAYGSICKKLILWCPEGDLNPHGLAACGF